MILLDLVLKAHWFDLINSGQKRNEYREYKPFWIKRLMAKKFTHIRLRRGYTKTEMIYEIKKIEISNEENDLKLPKVFKISLGERIK